MSHVVAVRAIALREICCNLDCCSVVSAASSCSTFRDVVTHALIVLVRALSHSRSNVRTEALRRLSLQGTLAGHSPVLLITLLEDSDKAVREQARVTIDQLQACLAPYVANLGRRCNHKRACVRENAVHQLGLMKSLGGQSPWRLLRMVRDPDEGVRGRAVDAVYQLRELLAPCTTKLVKLLQHRKEALRSSALIALGNLAEYATSHVDAVAARLEDTSVNVQLDAANAIADLTMHTGVPQLKSRMGDWLSSEDPVKRRAAAMNVSYFGKDAPVHIPMLVALLRDRDAAVSWEAVEALKALLIGNVDMIVDDWILDIIMTELTLPHNNDIVFIFLGLLDSTDDDVKAMALKVLADADAQAGEHIDAIAARLQDPSDNVREFAALAIFSLSAYAGAPHARALGMCLEDPSADVRGAAAMALGNLGELAFPFCTGLRACEHDAAEEVRRLAKEAVAALGLQEE